MRSFIDKTKRCASTADKREALLIAKKLIAVTKSASSARIKISEKLVFVFAFNKINEIFFGMHRVENSFRVLFNVDRCESSISELMHFYRLMAEE